MGHADGLSETLRQHSGGLQKPPRPYLRSAGAAFLLRCVSISIPGTVQENLGHYTAAFTLDVYGHVTERMKQESAARMENFMKRLKNLKG